MDNLDIQIVDSLTVNLNQENYSTEGQIQNDIAVYVEDEQQLFEAALTQDSINLYTRETPDIINIKEITDGIFKLESQIEKTSKEATLLAKVAELKEALNSIDFTVIEQAIQGVEDITAREATLIQGVEDIIKAVENIDFTDLENSIAEVKNAVVNIDFSAIAKEDTLKQGVQEIKGYVENIDFSAIAKEDTLLVESKAIKDKIDAIEIPVTDLTEVAKEDTLTQGVNTVSQKIDDIHIPELDKSDLAKEATLSSGISTLSNKIDNIDLSSVENKVDEGVETLANKIDNIDLSSVESKVETESQVIQSAIQNIDLSSVEGKVDEVKQAVEKIKLPEIDTTELAKESTLNAVSSKLDNLNVDVDLSIVAKQGSNADATNSAILDAVKAIESWSAKYDSTTGNLTIENVNITIE